MCMVLRHRFHFPFPNDIPCCFLFCFIFFYLYIFFDKVPVKVSGIFLIGFCSLVVAFQAFLYILDGSTISDGGFFCKYFLPVHGLSSHSLTLSIKSKCSFSFIKVQIVSYFFHELRLLVFYLKCQQYALGHLDFFCAVTAVL